MNSLLQEVLIASAYIFGLELLAASIFAGRNRRAESRRRRGER